MRVSYIASSYHDINFRSSINSLLDQDFDDYEVVLVLDGWSPDADTLEYLENCDKVIIVRNNINMGLTKSLNTALEIACGEIIIRHDCDDMSRPDRTRCIVNSFSNNVDIVGSFAEIIFTETGKTKITKIPLEHSAICKKLVWKNCLIHSAIAYRKHTIQKLDGYNSNYKYAQDYELYLRAMENDMVFHTIAKPLVIRSFSANNITIKNRKEQLLYVLSAQSKYFASRGYVSKDILRLLNTLFKLMIPMVLRRILYARKT